MLMELFACKIWKWEKKLMIDNKSEKNLDRVSYVFYFDSYYWIYDLKHRAD